MSFCESQQKHEHYRRLGRLSKVRNRSDDRSAPCAMTKPKAPGGAIECATLSHRTGASPSAAGTRPAAAATRWRLAALGGAATNPTVRAPNRCSPEARGRLDRCEPRSGHRGQPPRRGRWVTLAVAKASSSGARVFIDKNKWGRRKGVGTLATPSWAILFHRSIRWVPRAPAPEANFF